MSYILILDSGVGGLSIYQKIREQIKDQNTIYLCDDAAFPYGEKTEKFIIDRLHYLIEAISKQYSIKMIIVACNTASTICLPFLRAQYKVPIIGVVPAIKIATHLSQNKVVGLLATKGTLSRRYTKELIKTYQNDCQILQLGLSELAELVEKKLAGELIDFKSIEPELNKWRHLDKTPDVIVLGCTHYPFIKKELQHYFPNSLLIDSGEAIAKRVIFLLGYEQAKNKDDDLISHLFISTKKKGGTFFQKDFGFNQVRLF